MNRGMIRSIIKVSVTVLILQFFVVAKSYAGEPLSVNITTEDGKSVIAKDDSVIYTAVPIQFELQNDNNAKYYYSLSIDEGVSFGEYVPMEDNYLILYPNEDIVPNGRFILKFRQTVNITMDDTSDDPDYDNDGKEIISNDSKDSYSKEYKVYFDMNEPEINVLNKEVLGRWNNSNQTLNLLAEDKSGYISRIVATSSGKILYEKHFVEADKVDKYRFDLELTESSENVLGKNIEVTVYDFAANNISSNYQYYIDKNAPQLYIAGVEDGAIITENANIVIGIRKKFLDTTHLYYTIRHKYEGVENIDEIDIDSSIIKNGYYELPIDNEGYYQIEAYAYDDAGNKSDVTTLNFSVDKTAPVINIYGASDNIDYQKPVDLNICVSELFYDKCNVSVDISRVRQNMTVAMPIASYTLSAPEDTRLVSLKNDGDYEICVTATDGVGNVSSKSERFRIDAHAPLLDIEGVNEGELTNTKPTIRINAQDIFYDSTLITSKVLKRNNKKSYDIVNEKSYAMKKEIDYNDIMIESEGDYIIKCIAKDRSGNISEVERAFTVDYTPPVIQSFDKYDHKYMNRFKLPANISEVINDKSPFEYKMYLNDDSVKENYEVTEEGKYILWLAATDAAGNVATNSAEFIIDHTSPQIIVTGVGKDGIVKKGTVVKIELQDEEDSLSEIRINEQPISLASDKKSADFIVTDYGNYDIEVKAIDLAGNVTDVTFCVNCETIASQYIDYAKKYGETYENGSSQNEQENAQNIDVKGIIMGLISVLSGTYGLAFRGLRTI